jgi:predicted AlkP superfamily pyrophosphatase or phosphodiesterase
MLVRTGSTFLPTGLLKNMSLPRLISVWLSCFVLMSLSASLASGQLVDETSRHVIVVSLDGLAACLVDDPKASLPTIRRLASEGVIVDGGMKVSNPSITWPNHTTLITGVRPDKHGVLANGVLVRGGPGVPVRVDPKRDRVDLVRVPTVADAARAAGLRTAEINWPCTRNSDAYDDSFPDVPESLSHTTPRLRDELVATGLLSDPTDASFSARSWAGRDWVWTEAACHVIRQRKPHLMLVHLLTCDSTHHQLGAQTQAGYTANAYVDLCLDRIIAATKEAGILERTTFLVVSDHGFIMTPKAIKPNQALREAGMLTGEGGRIEQARMHVVPEGGIGLLYCTDPTEARELRLKARELLIGREGVADVVLPDAFDTLGIPLPREYEQAPDAVVVAEEGYAVSASSDGSDFVASHTDAKTSLGSHGFVASNPKMNACCILWGPNVRPGIKLQNIENIDVAPTIAKILGVALDTDGKPLDAAMISD